jgi:quercetin dioxygenase-like cupin family protein
MMSIDRALLCIAAALSMIVASVARAQDPVEVNPETIRVRLDNERVRVLEAVIDPGVKEKMHSHPANVIHVIQGGTIRSHSPDGKATETTFQNGEVLFREPVTHWAENIGTTQIRVLIVELKDRE